jgi:Diacylglycerol kinase catalytic domain
VHIIFTFDLVNNHASIGAGGINPSTGLEFNNYLPRTSDQHFIHQLSSASRNFGEENTEISFVGVEFHLYLFANPRSGSRKAEKFTTLGFSNCTVNLGQNMRAVTHVYNVVDPEDCDKGLLRIARRQKLSKSKEHCVMMLLDNPNHHIRLVMAGGDGSLMRLVLRANKQGCDIKNLACCVIPYGTGNDLARSLNWGGAEEESEIYKTLPRLVREICLNSSEKVLNVWKV